MSKPQNGRRIARLSGGDLMQWQADVGPVPQHIAGLLHLGPTSLTAAELVDHLRRRLARVPSLARFPVKPPFGAGNPIWLADNGSVRDHVSIQNQVGHADESLLARATVLMSQPFPPGRAPWAAHVLTDEEGTPVAVLVVLHHVLADGLAGIQLLTALARPDPPVMTGTGPDTGTQRLPSTMPSWPALARNAWAGRLRALGRAPSVARSLRPALHELGIGHGTLAPRSTLNRRTGPARRHAAVTLPEAPLRSAARGSGGSLNDAVLTVLAEILAEQAAQRGQDLDPVVVSVPVAARHRSTAVRAGLVDAAATNAVGVMPTPVPTRGPVTHRIAAVAAWRHARLEGDGEDAGASLPLALAAFRVLHALHLVRWFTDRQRLVNTFATALPGPTHPVALVGTPVTRITPLVLNQGNTTIAFASITYAGQLTISVVADPTCGPDPLAVGECLRDRLLKLVPADAQSPAPDVST
ncbi:MAG: wax ester/triacylglycerol synthase family O-acyltransferase [Actinomycetota bacterium]|nr:wax ester/triacylglycerol synthase family O-acyltransferase [Actinomycetota bacterium]